MGAPADPKARLDRALAKQRRLQKEAFRERRERAGESSVIRTFVAWVRGEGPDTREPDFSEPADLEAERQAQRARDRRTMGVLVLITVMLALIVFLLMVVALKVARS